MEKDEFCARFVAEIMKATEWRTDEPRAYFESYAKEVAPSYFEDKYFRQDGPEVCARGDMDNWE